MRPTEGTHRETPPGLQQTQCDLLGTDVREVASQAQAPEAMKQAEREGEEERAKRVRLGAGKGPTNKSPDGELEQRRDQQTEAEDGAATSCLFFYGHGRKQDSVKERQGSHRRGLLFGDRSTSADRWLEPHETVKSSVPLGAKFVTKQNSGFG